MKTQEYKHQLTFDEKETLRFLLNENLYSISSSELTAYINQNTFELSNKIYFHLGRKEICIEGFFHETVLGESVFTVNIKKCFQPNNLNPSRVYFSKPLIESIDIYGYEWEYIGHDENNKDVSEKVSNEIIFLFNLSGDQKILIYPQGPVPSFMLTMDGNVINEELFKKDYVKIKSSISY